jgi:hypothetical protein
MYININLVLSAHNNSCKQSYLSVEDIYPYSHCVIKILPWFVIVCIVYLGQNIYLS